MNPNPSRNVPAVVKAQLIHEAGGQCSNPACPNTVFELHHIREWAVYRTHDPAHMIALCPSCHDSVTRGELRLTDELLYEWKSLPHDRWGGVQVPPSTISKLLLGSISVASESPVAVFDHGAQQSLSFHLDATGRLLNVNASIHDLQGRTLLEVSQNATAQVSDGVKIDQRPGRMRVTVATWLELLPAWGPAQLLRYAPQIAGQGLPLFDIEVTGAGVVRVSGIWSTREHAVVITRESMLFLTDPDALYPLALEGQGDATVLHVNGPGILFGVEERVPAILNMGRREGPSKGPKER